MNNIEIIEYRSWNQFKASVNNDLFENGVFHRGQYLFRGQKNADWPLIPTFDREYVQYPYDQRRVIEKTLLFELQQEFDGTDYLTGKTSEVEIIAFSQHFGLPTRLLDWTLSPYVAAFFAFADLVASSSSTQHVAVWILDLQSPVWNAETGVEIVGVTRVGNVRLRNQQGKFTLSRTPFASLEEYVDKFKLSKPALKQVLIPTLEAHVAISDLDMMGINHSHLFPGPEGIIKNVRVRTALNLV